MSTIEQTLAAALAAHQAGNLAAAERLYAEVLRSDANHFDALHLLGALEAQRGRPAEALRLIGRALKIDPQSAPACSNQGLALHKLGRLDEALASFDRALALEPRYVDALSNRGNALRDLKRPEAALASYDRALSLDPRNISVLANRGAILMELKRYDDALATAERALGIQPRLVEALDLRGSALHELRRYYEALASYDQAISIRPDSPAVLVNRGATLADLHRHDAALADFERALALRPGYPRALSNRGRALFELGRHQEALGSLEQALARDPGYVAALVNRANIFAALRLYDRAIGDYQRILSLDPGHPYTLGNLLHARMHCCDWGSIAGDIARLESEILDGKPCATPFVLVTLSASAAVQLTGTQAYVRDRHPERPPLRRGAWRDHDRIRLAYISADFHDHATARLMAGLFERHDRSRFASTAVSLGPAAPSDMRRRLEAAFDHFIDARRMTDPEIAALLQQMEIDIAIDLKGFTGESRPDILAARPAPIQVNYLGYPGTMGAPYIDYIVADRVVIPQAHERFYSEKVVVVPDSYQVNDSKRPAAAAAPTRAALGLPAAGIVFCAFNNTYKITPDVFAVWMRLLQDVDGSVLWLLDANAAVAINLRREAAARGIAAERLIFAPRAEHAAHLARQGAADIFLDTLPCNAHTTASEALWAGLPVVTCLGTTFAGRVAASLLSAAGLPELIADSLETYHVLALRLARDPAALTAIKARLAAGRGTSPLFDTDRSRRHIEAAYATMWERHRRGEPPASFAVPPIAA